MTTRPGAGDSEPALWRPARPTAGLTVQMALNRPVRPDRRVRSLMAVIIVREMAGTSPHGWSDAARHAVVAASKTVRNIRTADVVELTVGIGKARS